MWYNLSDLQRIILQPETTGSTAIIISLLLFAFIFFSPGDIWRFEISVKIIRHRSNSSESTPTLTNIQKERRKADMHCAFLSNKRGMKRPFLPRGEAFQLGLPFWFTGRGYRRAYTAHSMRDPGGPRVRKEP